jgi:hypothetical protein
MSRILLRSLGLGATLVIATLSPAASKFDHAEYMKATATGQKKAEPQSRERSLLTGEEVRRFSGREGKPGLQHPL